MVNKQNLKAINTGRIYPIILEDEDGIFIYDYITNDRINIISSDQYKYWNDDSDPGYITN